MSKRVEEVLGGACGRGHRVAPAPLAVHAWVEREGAAPEEKRLLEKRPAVSAPEQKRLLPPGLWEAGHAPPASPAPKITTAASAFNKTDFEKKKRRLYEILRPPYFIISMIIVFVCMEVWADGRVRAALEYAPGRRREAWRLLTYCALHAGAQHLALNALVALAVGWVLEREQGAARVAALWAGGVVAGALGASALQPAVHVVGASAGVYALLTSHLANVALGYGHVKMCWFRLLAVCVLGASDCAWLLLRAAPPLPAAQHAAQHAAHAAQHAPPVAWAAHALGAAVGLPLALLVFTGVNSGARAVRWARAASAALLLGAGAAAVYCNLYLHPDTER